MDFRVQRALLGAVIGVVLNHVVFAIAFAYQLHRVGIDGPGAWVLALSPGSHDLYGGTRFAVVFAIVGALLPKNLPFRGGA